MNEKKDLNFKICNNCGKKIKKEKSINLNEKIVCFKCFAWALRKILGFN